MLLIHGLKDQALLPGALNDTWNWIDKDLTLVTIPGAGHFVQQDAAELVTKTMVSWLSRELNLEQTATDPAFVDRRPFGTTLVPENELRVIHPQSVQDRRMDIVNVQPVLDGMKTHFIGLPDHDSRLHAPSGHPHREAVRVVVPPVAFLGHRRAAELSAPDHQRFVQQAAALEVFQKSRDRPVHGAAGLSVVGFDARMSIPLAARAAVDLHEPHTALDESSGQQAQPPDAVGRRIVQAV